MPSEFAALYGAKKGVFLGPCKRGNCLGRYRVPNAMGRAGRVGRVARGAWGAWAHGHGAWGAWGVATTQKARVVRA